MQLKLFAAHAQAAAAAAFHIAVHRECTTSLHQFVRITNALPASEGADCGVVQELLLGKRTVLAGAA